MSRTVSLAVVLLFAVAVSPLPFLVGGDDPKSGIPSAKEAGTTTQPSETEDEGKDAEGTAAQRIRLERAVEDSIRQKLLKRVTIDFDERQIGTVLTELADEYGLPFAIDLVALSGQGVALDTTVSLHVKDITLRSVLNLLLKPMQLDTVILDEVLTVTTSVRAGEVLKTRVYDVAALVPEVDFTELIDLIASCVEPESWDTSGGPASISAQSDSRTLVIRETQRIHDQITQLLSDLEAATTSPPREISLGAIREREATIRRNLIERCTVHCDNVALLLVIADLVDTHSLPLWRDAYSLADEGISIEQGVTARLDGVRIESALNHLLRPRGLAWIIDDEVLKVTTKVRAAEHLTTRVYDVRDIARVHERTWPPPEFFIPNAGLMGADAPAVNTGRSRQSRTNGQSKGNVGSEPFDVASPHADVGSPDQAAVGRRGWILRQGFGDSALSKQKGVRQARQTGPAYDLEELLHALRFVDPDSWDQVGGPGVMREFRNTIVVRQTESVHAQIEVLFENLREMKRLQIERAKVDSEDPTILKRVVYDFARFSKSAEDLARLIPEIISPDSWKNAGGKGALHLQPQALVIEQTQAVHREIVKLLYEVVLGYPSN